MKLVYVKGCLGSIGFYVAKAALDKGWRVYGVDKVTYAADVERLDSLHKTGRFKFERKDINDLEFFYECDYVVNAAAETHVDNSILSSSVFLDSNVKGVYHMLELIRVKTRFSKPVFLQFSTDEVYGDIAEGFHTESDILKPSNPYSATKASADMLVQAWGRTYGIPYVIVRPTNNYGAGQYIEKLIPKACKQIQLGRKVPLHQNGLPRRTWLHVEDTADAVVSIIESGKTNEIFNISGNYEDSNLAVVHKILHCFYPDGYDINDYADFTYTRHGQDVRYAIDDSKLKALGWEPKQDFDTRLPEIVYHYRRNFIW